MSWHMSVGTSRIFTIDVCFSPIMTHTSLSLIGLPLALSSDQNKPLLAAIVVSLYSTVPLALSQDIIDFMIKMQMETEEKK